MLCHSLDTAHTAVCALVEDFSAQEAYFLSPKYSEAQVRVSYIDKLWQALGWDVTHEHQRNPYQQEVRVENPQKIGGHSRRADYAFHVAPNFRDARFFCEAKKPYVQLRTDADAAFQTLRYGWSASTPLAILTDFEQLHIFDCRAKPNIDTALQRSHRFFQYKDWLKKEIFAEFYYLFSREAFNPGPDGAPSSHEAYLAKLPRPKKVGSQLGLLRAGSQPVDAAFLTDLEDYRETLAKMLKAADHSLDGETLTELVQRVLDRLIFLRFLEDKLIETEHQVHHFSRAAGGHSWAKFLAASRKLDTRYNGIVFKHHSVLDDPTKLPVDDARFADLCEELSHTKSPYDFNAIPIHILGSIYERFLGKIIVTTEQRAKVEEKPEVRKAGGVYYTPEYIVHYICQQTVGKLIEGKSPAQIAKLHFADIACGSGSFLLGVYDLLLRYHAVWYNAHSKEALEENLAPPGKNNKRKKEYIPAVVEQDGVLRLTLEKKREILLNNVFGVDLDPQAVEVAQLSLYLKLLEDETTASAAQHYLDFHEALLPPLNKNIVRGNSLIGTDILFGQFEFSAQEERKLAPMDFESAFPAIMNEGGFDVIVGNPPYGATIDEHSVAYLQEKFETSSKNPDTYAIFIEQALSKAKSDGKVGFIVPTGWYSGAKYPRLRRYVARNSDPIAFVNLPYDVFADAWVDTTVLALSRREKATAWPRSESVKVEIKTFPKRHRILGVEEFYESVESVDFANWFIGGEDTFLTYTNEETNKLIRKISTTGRPLGELSDVQRGITPFHLTLDKAHANSIPAFDGTVRRYILNRGEKLFVRFDESLAEYKPERYFKGPRMLVRELISRQFRLQATKVTEDFVTNKSMQSVLPILGGPDIAYLLGCFNSNLLSWYFLKRSNIANRDDFPKIVLKETRSFPIPNLDLQKPEEKKQHDRMVQLVEAMLATQQQIAGATNDKDRTYYENKAAGLDRQIDELTFDLYGLTDEERALVCKA